MSPTIKQALNKKDCKQKDGQGNIRSFNAISLLLLFVVLIFYALTVNDCMGKSIKIDNLEEEREEIKSQLGSETSSVNSLRVPSYIQSRVEEKMLETKEVTYLRDQHTGIAVINQ